MPLLFQLIALAVKARCQRIVLRTHAQKVVVRIHQCPEVLELEESPELLERSKEDEVETFILSSSQFDFRRLELQKRLNSAPVPIILNGTQLNHGVDMSRTNNYVISRRFFLSAPEQAQFCSQPVWDAKESNFKAGEKLAKLCWKQDAYLLTEEGPQAPSEGYEQMKVGSGFHGLPCCGMAALGYNLDKPSVIHWIDNGVWLDSQEVELGFPGCWAVCTAQNLPKEEFRVADSEGRTAEVERAKREIDYLLMDVDHFRGHSYPKYPSMSRTLFILVGLGAGWYTGLLWPFIAGPAIGEGLEWYHHSRAGSRFWKAVDGWKSSRGRALAGPQKIEG